MKEFGSIPEDVKSATLSLRVRLKGDFLTFYRNRNTANQKSLISPQPQGLAVGPLTAKKELLHKQDSSFNLAPRH